MLEHRKGNFLRLLTHLTCLHPRITQTPLPKIFLLRISQDPVRGSASHSFTPPTCHQIWPSIPAVRFSLLPRSPPFKFRSPPLFSKLLLKISTPSTFFFFFNSISSDPHFLEPSSSSPAMARLLHVFLPLLLAFLLVQFTASSSPSPSPQPEADSPSPSSDSPQISFPPSPSGAPTKSPAAASPPAPPTSSSPSPQPGSTADVPAPEPSDASDVNHSDMTAGATTASSDGGMSAGKKAGIGLGVIVGVGLVALGGFVYKRRQDNIRRSQYGYAARRELL